MITKIYPFSLSDIDKYLTISKLKKFWNNFKYIGKILKYIRYAYRTLTLIRIKGNSRNSLLFVFALYLTRWGSRSPRIWHDVWFSQRGKSFVQEGLQSWKGKYLSIKGIATAMIANDLTIWERGARAIILEANI